MENLVFADRVSSLEGSAIREMFKLLGNPEIISFAGGAPAPEIFPVGELSEIAREVLLEKGDRALQYGITEGYTPLRSFVSERMRDKGNMKAEDDVIITTGGQQAIDLAAKTLVNEGDVVLVESPSFVGGLNSLRSYNAKLIGIPVQDDGMDVDAVEEEAKKQKIKMVYAITTFQNPSGITMSLEKRKRLLQLAEKYNFYVLEDNPYEELRFSGEAVQSIKSLDTTGRVIYAGSFSKVLSAGIRLGWVLASKEIFEKMVVVKQVSDVHTPVLNQMMAMEFFKKYSLDAHIEKSRKLYGERCSVMLGALDEHFPEGCTYTRPEGGIFLWCSLPGHIDTAKLLRLALEKNIAFVPGSTCMVDMSAHTSQLRLNYSLTANEKIEEGIKRLSEVIITQI